MHHVGGSQELFLTSRWISRDAFISHKFPGVQAHLYKECQRFNSSTLLVKNLWTCAVQSWKKLASLSLNHSWPLIQFLLCILHWVLPLNVSTEDPCYGTDLWNYFVLISTISLWVMDAWPYLSTIYFFTWFASKLFYYYSDSSALCTYVLRSTQGACVNTYKTIVSKWTLC